VITITYDRDHGAMSRTLGVTKARASSHDAAIRPFSVSADGISLNGGRPVPGQPEQG
jgi:hypothetical protein